MAQSGKIYDSFHEYDMDAYQPTDRFYVRSSVYLPNSDVDPRTGMLRQGAHTAGRTQALRMEAQRLDQEYARMDAALQSRREEKGLRVNLRTAMMMTFALLVAFALMLLTQQGVLDQYARRVKAVDQKNAVLQTNIQDLQGQIAEASDQATICYAAARNIGMVPAASTQAIHLTAMDTRPGSPDATSAAVTAQNQMPQEASGPIGSAQTTP